MYNDAIDSLDLLEAQLRANGSQPRCPDDPYVVAAIEEAIAAAREGNFGVGAVIVDSQGAIVARGHNHVFYPYFRSDIHAEMDVMDRFEDSFTEVNSMQAYTLFTSLEPCPMCLTRLITSGIGRVYHAAPDVESGMALANLTQVWIDLAKLQTFAPADCSEDLARIAHQVFLVTANHNTQKLIDRRMGKRQAEQPAA